MRDERSRDLHDFNGSSSSFALPCTNDAPEAPPSIVDLTGDCSSPVPTMRKRKHGEEPETVKTSPRKKRAVVNREEKRLKRFRTQAPKDFDIIAHRALTQRMCILDRQRIRSPNHPVEHVSLAGTTGNVYRVTIDQIPTCDCPHAQKGNKCKHVVYVLARTLRARYELQYQLALLPSELCEIFANAPPLPSEQGDDSAKDGRRKPVEGECPICCVDFEPEGKSEEIVYCRAACGNNIHKTCFDQWAASKREHGVTCPFCRTPWEGEQGALRDIVRAACVSPDGYANVADQLGFSQVRDTSTYNEWWPGARRRQSRSTRRTPRARTQRDQGAASQHLEVIYV